MDETENEAVESETATAVPSKATKGGKSKGASVKPSKTATEKASKATTAKPSKAATEKASKAVTEKASKAKKEETEEDPTTETEKEPKTEAENEPKSVTEKPSKSATVNPFKKNAEKSSKTATEKPSKTATEKPSKTATEKPSKTATTAPPKAKTTKTKKGGAGKDVAKVVFEEDLANFLGDTWTTDEEEEEDEGFDDPLIQIGPTTQGQASSFWKNPEIPEKYPLDHVNVENLVNMLSKIHLVWPENLPHYDETEFSTEPERAKFPSTFWHNTDKEKVVMWHAENFRRQFLQKFPKRRTLVIAPKNECGCQKLFPTYINPVSLGYPEFLDCVTTVEFLKDFFKPDLMNPPTKFPERIRSHQTVIKKRTANAFEIAIVAVSSLIGNGYNAYVVDGYVSRTLSTIDTTEDYHEPTEKPVIPYDIEDETQVEEKKSFAHSFDFGYGYFMMQEEEEETVPTVSPSKYRFKKRDEQSAMTVGDHPIGETGIMADAASSFVQPLHLQPVAGIGGAGAEQEVASQMSNLEGGEEGEDETEADDLEEGGGSEEPEVEEVKVDEGEKEEEEDDEEAEQEESEPDEELPPFAKDRYHGKRVHAWILVLPGGLQDVEKPFFLEPFSGTWRAIKDPNFLEIEAVFNQKNYWINIQPPPKNLRKLNYDLDNPSAWSCLLHDPNKKKKRSSVAEGSKTTMFEDDDEDELATKSGELVLTMPVTWTSDMDISQEEYDMKYPAGKKNIEYNDAIVELAAPYVNDDGLVRKVLKFVGPSRDPEDLEYIEEHFEHRKDKLEKRKWFRDGKVLHEYFEKGRKDALKEHVHVSGRNMPDFPRDLYYYSNAHPRSVAHRRIIKKGIIEHFEDREDKLHYKITLFGGMLCNTIPNKEAETKGKARQIMELIKGAGAGGGRGTKRARRKITKIVEKYARNEESDPTQDISEKHMLIDEGRLRILFHYTPGNFSRNTLEFYKGIKPGQSKFAPVEYRPEDCIEYLANRESEPMNVSKKFLLLQQMDRDERSSSVMVREAVDEVYQTVTSRVQEDWRHEIEPDAFAGDRNEEYLRMMKEQNATDEGEVEMDLSGTDFTTPFFEKYGYPRNKREEILMKKRIMLHEKVKILRRAYMIKELYDKESSLLREKQEWYTRHIDQMNQTQEEDFSHMYKERLFQMHILEQRMIRHQQEAPRQYYTLLVQLLRHPQLNRFTNKKVPPPPAPLRELTEEEKARIAKELAKLKDCCQFYSYRYTEPRKSRNRPNQNKQLEDGEEEEDTEAQTSNEGEQKNVTIKEPTTATGSTGSGKQQTKPPSVTASVPTSSAAKGSSGSSGGARSSKGSGGQNPTGKGETVVASI